jgi:hypothetical protein
MTVAGYLLLPGSVELFDRARRAAVPRWLAVQTATFIAGSAVRFALRLRIIPSGKLKTRFVPDLFSTLRG